MSLPSAPAISARSSAASWWTTPTRHGPPRRYRPQRGDRGGHRGGAPDPHGPEGRGDPSFWPLGARARPYSRPRIAPLGRRADRPAAGVRGAALYVRRPGARSGRGAWRAAGGLRGLSGLGEGGFGHGGGELARLVRVLPLGGLARRPAAGPRPRRRPGPGELDRGSA